MDLKCVQTAKIYFHSAVFSWKAHVSQTTVDQETRVMLVILFDIHWLCSVNLSLCVKLKVSSSTSMSRGVLSPLVFHLCPDESGHANLCQFLPALLNQICFPVTFSIKSKSHLRIAVLTYWRRFSMQHRGKSAKAQNEMSIKWLRDKSARIKSTKFRFLRADSHRAI